MAKSSWQATDSKCGDHETWGGSICTSGKTENASSLCHLQALTIWVGTVAQAWVACSNQVSFTLWGGLKLQGAGVSNGIGARRVLPTSQRSVLDRITSKAEKKTRKKLTCLSNRLIDVAESAAFVQL